MARRSRRIKILATLGPGLRRPRDRRGAVRAGADVFRINMSHASHDVMRERVAMIRSLEEQFDRPIGILVDLQGPKLRVGIFANGGGRPCARATVHARRRPDARRRDARAICRIPKSSRRCSPATALLIDDGKVQLRVQSRSDRPRGMHGRGRRQDLQQEGRQPARHDAADLGDDDKDRADLDAALEENIDWIALSFVQRPEDVVEVKQHRRQARRVMAKIEKPQAIAAPRRDHRRLRRADGGARRSRRRNAARARARPAEDASRAWRAARQAGRRRDADAGIDDHDAGADARRSLRRRDRGVRGRRRGHAVGRKRLGPISARGGGDDEPHRRNRGVGGDLSEHHAVAARDARGDRRRRHRRGDARRRRHARRARSSAPGPPRARPACASRASGRARRSSR